MSPSDIAQNDVLGSECESLDGHSSSSEDSEQSPHCSDGSISDEESLIEITLPKGHFLDSEKDTKLSFQHHQKVFHSLVDYQLGDISDMNEEDNLIEIDISMGSIKHSEFEIQA
ncbi:uncharacterized protein LOC132640502 [Lycium barbarum]|uniref:uncharacterized protein LOC132640502 n=1 Tax=Lycium barbarum TaxID=112863 RepID=UPI00293F071B|nr:uncharacterized protein LOC132640502 [Lycium barbarum]